MEPVPDNKCSCANCGAVIHYCASQTGQIVECPACHEKSQLPEPIIMSVIREEDPAEPGFKNCAECGARMKLWERFCKDCEQSSCDRESRKRKLLVTALILILALLGLAALYYFKPAPPPAETKSAAKPARVNLTIYAATNIPTANGSHGLIAQPSQFARATNDLQPGRFVLEKKRGSDLVVAVGDIENVSEVFHIGLRADLDLLDKSGAKIGTVSDYSNELGPHQSWHFLATVTDTNAFSARLASISEKQ